MKITHLNCGTGCPHGGRKVNPALATIVCHCLLLETASGLVLIDSGLALQQLAQPPGAQALMPALLGFRGGPAEAAVTQLRRLGFDPRDVRHVVLTHLDWDHASGIQDFPEATIHLYGPEWEAAMSPHSVRELIRYRFVKTYEGRAWRRHFRLSGEAWFGFGAVRQLEGLPEDLALIPLPGHTRGHTGVAVRDGDRWLLHAGDAFFIPDQIAEPRAASTRAMRLFESSINVDVEAARANMRRLAQLAAAESERVTVFASHDQAAFERLAGRG